MANLVLEGALLKCDQGTATCALVVTAEHPMKERAQQLATVEDWKPDVNITSFGLCSSLTNPKVIAATAAANGVLTPMPCEPVVEADWAPGHPRVKLKNKVALSDASKCACKWAGVIAIEEGVSQTPVGDDA